MALRSIAESVGDELSIQRQAEKGIGHHENAGESTGAQVNALITKEDQKALLRPHR